MSLINDLRLKNLPLLFCFYLTACEQRPQTIEERYLNEVEEYNNTFAKENNHEDLLETPPFIKSTNKKLNEIRNSFIKRK